METAVSMSYERENSPEIPALKSAVGTQENTKQSASLVFPPLRYAEK